MRIGVVYLGRRGAGGMMALESATALCKLADVFAVISKQAENYPLWEREGLPFLSISTYESSGQAARSFLVQKPIVQLAARIENLMPDVLLFPMFHPWNALLQKRLAAIPSVVIVHDSEPRPGLGERIGHLLQSRSIRRAQRCIVFSRSMQPTLVRQGVDAARIDTIPAAMPNYFQKYFPIPNCGGDDSARLLFFGRITPYKGLQVLLNAYRQLEPPPGLLLVGDGDLSPYAAMIKTLRGVRVENRWVPDAEVPSYFKPGSIVVLPYTSATQSGVIGIAAAYGLPVIATRVGGIPEQVRDGETGLLVPPGDADALRGAIERLLHDPALAQRLGSHLKQEAAAIRNWEVIAARLMESCHRAAAR